MLIGLMFQKFYLFEFNTNSSVKEDQIPFIFNEKDVNPAIDWDYNDDKTTSNDNKYQENIKGNNHD